MISQRPPEAADRAVPGHWEGDLILGRKKHSAIATLVDRSTRYLMLVHLPDGYNSAAVRDALIAAINPLPPDLKRSLTCDQGTEMAAHRGFSMATNVPVYFCDPAARGSAARMKTPTACSASTFPRAPTCPSTLANT